MKKYLLIFILMLLFAGTVWGMSQAVAQSDNLLTNPSFEEGLENKIPKGWGKNYYNCSLSENAKIGKFSLKISNTKPGESMGAQEIPLDGRKINKINVAAWVKGEKITAGKIAWQKANLQPLFFDEKGNQVGGWPELGPWDGTFNWIFVRKTFKVPLEARKLKIVLGLNGCTGTVYFDDIKVYEYKEIITDPHNLVSHGDFEIWEDWAYGGTLGGGLITPGYVGEGMLKIHNPTPTWSFASQSIPLDGRKISEIKVSSFMKIENVVQGKRPYQQARINIEFKDSDGKRIGGWPIVYSAVGSFDWKKIENSFMVPEETRRVDMFVGLMECTGTIWVDDLKMEGKLRSGGTATRASVYTTNTSTWYTFNPPANTFNKNAIDMRFLLDAPAGKHGFLKVKNGHFYFADGTRARFWGTNVYGADVFVDKATADKMALRLAQSGCNLVRLHHMDAYWANPNIFDRNYDDTLHLSKAQLDQMDYFVYALKKQGIYVFMDLLVDREFKKGDGVADYQNVERGAKVTGFYNKRIIDLQKQFAKQILLHVNPYTQKRYVDDPAIVSVKLINEAMLFYLPTYYNLSHVHLKELDTKWNAYLKKKYGSTQKLKQAWTDKYGKCDLRDDEDITKGNIARGEILLKFQRGGYERPDALRDADTMRFYYALQVAYYKDMHSFLKSIGVKVPISGSNHWVNIAADVKSNTVLDYVDRHRYWDHPQFGYGTEIVFEDLPMVKYPESALPNNFAYYKVADKPYCISEWNNCFPNEWRAEGPIIMAAYSNLHDWDAVLQFSFNKNGWYAPMTDNFDISSWPNVLTQWQTAAMIFYRGDVSPAKYMVEEPLSDSSVFGPIQEDSPILNEPFLPLITKTQIRFVGNDETVKVKGEPHTILNNFLDRENKTLTSDNQELFWNWDKGIFLIRTDRTQSVTGFIDNYPIKLPNIDINCKNQFASISLSSLSKTPIESSKHLLLTAVGRIENTNQKYNESKTQLKQVGLAPLLVEGINASITINRPIDAATVYALDINGNRTGEISAAITSSSLSFNISNADQTCYYEIVIK